MHEPTVYDILNQTQKGSKQTSRLLHALEELAGRLESVSAHGTGAAQSPAAADSSTCKKRGSGRYQRSSSWELCSLQLPDPHAGLLPLFPGASEFDALQAAAIRSSSQLQSRAEQLAWRSWLMRPSHVVLVVEAAWLLLSLLFKQEDPCAAALQERVYRQLCQHYVSEVLAGQAAVKNATGMWPHALADAACQLLRRAFPTVAELADAQLQQVLQQQLRLWTTGLLPSDVRAPSLNFSAKQAAAAAADVDGSDVGAGNDDGFAAATTTPRANKAARCVAAPFISVKPGPLVSSFMAAQGIKPAALLHAMGPQLRSLTVTQQQQQQQQQDSIAGQLAAADHAAVQQSKLQQRLQAAGLSLLKSSSITSRGTAWVSGSTSGAQQQANDTSAAAGTSNRRVQAAACLAAAAVAADQYSSSKKASAAAASRSRGTLHKELQQLEVTRRQMVLGGTNKVQAASNQIVGRLSEPGGAAAALPATLTDAQCKAQRQLMQGHLRHGELQLARTFNASVHAKCLNMAAAVAVLPPPPACNGPVSSSSSCSIRGNATADARFDRPGGGWASIAGCSLVSSRLSKAREGGTAAAMGGATKVTKAAKAIVEDVRRKYAATPVVSSPPRRR